MEEIDLFDRLEKLEKILGEAEKGRDKTTAKRIKKLIKIVNEAIKRENPDLVLDGDDEPVCTCEAGGEEDCDIHKFMEL